MTNAKGPSHIIVHTLTSDAAGKKGHRSTCFLSSDEHEGHFLQQMAESWSGGGPLKRLDLAFADVFVPDDAIQHGELHGGFTVMAETLNGGRLFVAGLALASTAFALDEKCRTLRLRAHPVRRSADGTAPRVQDVILDLDIALDRPHVADAPAGALRRREPRPRSRPRRSRSMLAPCVAPSRRGDGGLRRRGVPRRVRPHETPATTSSSPRASERRTSHAR